MYKFKSSLMDKKELWDKINAAYKADKVNHPSWPDHICGQAAMVGKEAGNLLVVAVEKKYKTIGLNINNLNPHLENSAIGTIVQAVRFLENLK